MAKKAKGKHRLDKFYHLAKEQGFRSRAAFKLVQLNKKYDFLGKARTLLDLCAAPGGWLQVAHKYMPMSSVIVGVDLVPIKPIRGVITLTEDITTERCRSAIKKVLPPGGLFDVVVCDGAPNVGGAWSSEAYTQAALVLEACKLATEFLAPRGLFLTKVFRSAEYHALLYAFGQLFDRVESTKPVASRATSAEIYVACHGFRAPGRLDRRLLDPAHLFAPTEDGGGGGGGALPEAPERGGRDVVHGPDAPRRNRGGYDEALRGVLWRAADAEAAFIAAEKPAEALGAFGALTVSKGSPLDIHPATTPEVRSALADLRVLAKRDFRTLLRWRQAVLKSRAAEAKAAARAAGADGEDGDEAAGAGGGDGDGDEEDVLLAEMEALQERAEARKRREKKTAAKAKGKARLRAALGAVAGGTAAAAAGDSAYGADGELFALRAVRGGAEGLARVAPSVGGGADPSDEDAHPSDSEDAFANILDGDAPRRRAAPSDDDGESDSDADEARLENELDAMYEAYAARRGVAVGAAARRRERARLGAPSELPGADVAAAGGDGDGDQDWDMGGSALAKRTAAAKAEEAAARNPLLMAPRADGAPLALGRGAAAWFSQPAFAGIGSDDDDDGDGQGMGSDEDDVFDDDDDDEVAPAAARGAKRGAASAAPAAKRRRAAESDSDDDADDIRAAARAAAAGWAAAEAAPAPPLKGPKGKKDKAAAAAADGGDFEVVPAGRSGAASGRKRAAGGDPDASSGSDSEDRELDATLTDAEKAEIRAYGKLFMRRKSRDAMIEAGYHKWAQGGGDDMPDWFAADEARHVRPPAPPLSAAERAAARDALRALNARPIKKVAEAKARKKRRAYARLEAAKSAANAIADQEDTPLASRMRQIERVYAKSARGRGRDGGKGGKDGKKGGKDGKGSGPKLDPRMRKDARQVGAKKKAAASKKGGKKGGSKGGKGGRGR